MSDSFDTLRGTAVISLNPEHYILVITCKVVDRCEGKVPRYELHLAPITGVHSGELHHTGISAVQVVEALSQVKDLGIGQSTLRRIVIDLNRLAMELALPEVVR